MELSIAITEPFDINSVGSVPYGVSMFLIVGLRSLFRCSFFRGINKNAALMFLFISDNMFFL